MANSVGAKDVLFRLSVVNKLQLSVKLKCESGPSLLIASLRLSCFITGSPRRIGSKACQSSNPGRRLLRVPASRDRLASSMSMLNLGDTRARLYLSNMSSK